MIIIGLIRLVMLIVGFVVIGKGMIKLTSKTAVTGSRAKIIGTLLILPYPGAFIAGFLQGYLATSSGNESAQYDQLVDLIAIGLMTGFGSLALILYFAWTRSK